MNRGELAWTAGFLEGEGCFHLLKCNNKRFGLYHYPRVVVGSTDLDVLGCLQRYSEVGRIIGPRQRGTDKPVWQWTVSKTDDAVRLMEAIYPLMGQRRRTKIAEVLDFVGWKGPPHPSRSADLDRRAWVAGFLEAEGAFYWMTFQKGKYGPYYYPRVGVGGTDQDVIELLPQYTGVGQITGPYRKKPPLKNVWYWTVTKRNDATALMESIYPYMGERRRAQIDDVLSFVERERQQRLQPPAVIRLEEVELPQPSGSHAHTTTAKGRV